MKLSFSNKQLQEILRPEIMIEYQSIAQLPLITFTILKFRKRKVVLNLMCGKYTLGKQKLTIKPKYRLKKAK